MQLLLGQASLIISFPYPIICITFPSAQHPIINPSNLLDYFSPTNICLCPYRLLLGEVLEQCGGSGTFFASFLPSGNFGYFQFFFLQLKFYLEMKSWRSQPRPSGTAGAAWGSFGGSSGDLPCLTCALPRRTAAALLNRCVRFLA